VGIDNRARSLVDIQTWLQCLRSRPGLIRVLRSRWTSLRVVCLTFELSHASHRRTLRSPHSQRHAALGRSKVEYAAMAEVLDLPMIRSPLAGFVWAGLLMFLRYLRPAPSTPHFVNKLFGHLQSSALAWLGRTAMAQTTPRKTRMASIALAAFFTPAPKPGSFDHLPGFLTFLRPTRPLSSTRLGRCSLRSNDGGRRQPPALGDYSISWSLHG